MSKRVKRIKECVAFEEVQVKGRKRKKKIYEHCIFFMDDCIVFKKDDWNSELVKFPKKFNWTKWRKDHPGQQLTLQDVWEGYI